MQYGISEFHKILNVAFELKELKVKYVIVAADKAPNNFVFISKKYYLLVLTE